MTTTEGIVGEFRSLKAGTDADLLAMQCGDFYEFFGEDAEIVGEELDLRVSEKSSGGTKHPMAGVPVADVTAYLKALVERGYRVAVADQYETEDGHAREVVRVVTPGTLLETTDAEATYIASVVHEYETQRYGLAFADVTTGRFLVTTVPSQDGLEPVLSELYRFDPVEILPGPSVREDDRFLSAAGDRVDAQLTTVDVDAFAPGAVSHRLREHFGRETLDSLDLDAEGEPGAIAAGAILAYVEETGIGVLRSMTRLQRYRQDDQVVLDATTQRNLELVETLTGEGEGTLFETIDHTVTSGGARLLREWVGRPRRSREVLQRRHECVGALCDAAIERDVLRDRLGDAYDLERLASRISHGSADARALLQVRDTLAIVPDVVETAAGNERLSDSPLGSLLETLDLSTVRELETMLDEALVEDPPRTLTEGGLLRPGHDEELDRIVKRLESALSWIEDLEVREQRRHDITHLTVDRNRTDGYYLQVGRSEVDQVPDEYEQVKELKHSIRFTTPTLKEREREILHLEEERGELEYRRFQELRDRIADRVTLLQDVGRVIAEVDVLASLATHAVERRWTRPELADAGPIEITAGRHPVVEATTDFVPNDATLSDERSFVIVTGPNMSGKSTYMRQVALIVLLAQIGSFVPAEEARIGLVDGIYTRVGALDELAKGRSTFMVEMQELSNILHSATEDSLVVLDEVGRGTATYDGISIAWAATEYIHNEIRARTLFATHYHELTVLADHLPRVTNVHVTAEERDGSVTFLRTVEDGPTDRSYGVHVAALAGVPNPVVERAREVLDRLRREKAIEARGGTGEPSTRQVVFDLGSNELRHDGVTADGGRADEPTDDRHPVLEELAELDVNEVAPVEVATRVQQWQSRLTDGDEGTPRGDDERSRAPDEGTGRGA